MDSKQNNNKNRENNQELIDLLVKNLDISEDFAKRYSELFLYLAESIPVTIDYRRKGGCKDKNSAGYNTLYDKYYMYFAPREIRYDGKYRYDDEYETISVSYYDFLRLKRTFDIEPNIHEEYISHDLFFAYLEGETPPPTEEEIEKYIREEAFVATLFKYIEKKNLDPVDVYKKANIDRRLFSKIRRKPDYMPSRRTAVAFAIALELTLEETDDLIGRAGFRLSNSIPFDVIIKYFIEKGNYNIFEINEVLFAFNQPLLGE